MSFALEVVGVEKTYQSRSSVVRALSAVSFRVAAGEFVCLVGPSGCGKSTLLRILAGLTGASAGSLRFDGAQVSSPPRSAMVFQEHGLFPWLTVLDNVAFGLEMQGVAREAREARAGRFMAQAGLAGFAASYPHELSVGMRQRAAIARAFLVEPQLLLMDEPFSALDAQTKLILQEELLRIWKDHQTTVVYITHDIEEAVLLADRVLVMSGRPGTIREEITVPLERPRRPEDREHPEIRRIVWHIWKMIEDEVRQGLLRPA